MVSKHDASPLAEGGHLPNERGAPVADLKAMTIAAQDQFLAALTTSQAAMLDGVKTFSASIADTMPKMPAVPGMDAVPSPVDALEMGFDFAARLLANQREFMLALVGAATPAPAKTAKVKAA